MSDTENYTYFEYLIRATDIVGISVKDFVEWSLENNLLEACACKANIHWWIEGED